MVKVSGSLVVAVLKVGLNLEMVVVQVALTPVVVMDIKAHQPTTELEQLVLQTPEAVAVVVEIQVDHLEAQVS